MIAFVFVVAISHIFTHVDLLMMKQFYSVVCIHR